MLRLECSKNHTKRCKMFLFYTFPNLKWFAIKSSHYSRRAVEKLNLNTFTYFQYNPRCIDLMSMKVIVLERLFICLQLRRRQLYLVHS